METPQLLTAEESSKLLQLSRATMGRLFARGEIKALVLEGRFYTTERWLKDYVLTPENGITKQDLEDLHTPPALIRGLLDYGVRVRKALEAGATTLEEIPPPSPEVLDAMREEDADQGIFQ